MDLLAQMSWGLWFMAFLIIAVCVILIGVILLQRGRGGGLAGAFGGGGGSAAFGAKTGDVFTWITVVMAAIFVLLTVVGNFMFDQTPTRPTAATAAPLLPQPVGATESLPFTVTPVQGPPPGAGPAAGEGAPVSTTPVSIPVTITPSGEATGEDEAGTTQPADVDATSGDTTTDDAPVSNAPPSQDPQPSATDEQVPPEGSDEEPPER